MIKNEYISIIIPVYNEELSIKFVLVELIRVLKRTFKKYEIIVINDGSTDKTGFIVEKLKQDNLKNLKIVNLKKRVGQSLALQIGINKAKGDILFFF